MANLPYADNEIVIASVSRQDAEQIQTQIQSALASDGIWPKLTVIAFDTPDPGATKVYHSRPCAVLLHFTQAAPKHTAYLSYLDACISLVEKYDDFRLYIISDGNLLSSYPDGDCAKLLKSLVDCVQLEAHSTVENIAIALKAYLRSLHRTRKLSVWNTIRVGAAAWIGYSALLLQIVCGALSFAIALWLPIWDPKATLGSYSGYQGYVFLACGIGGMPFLLLLVFSYSHYGVLLHRMFDDPSGVLRAGIASLIGPLIIVTPLRLHAPPLWLILAILFGLMVDAARRNSYQARRMEIKIAETSEVDIHQRLPEALRNERDSWFTPWRCPLLPLSAPRVFISYTRTSAWSRDLVRTLSSRLSALQAEHFSDQRIDRGQNWRRLLNSRLASSTVLLSLVDAHTVDRKWPGAELEAALKGRRLTGLPELIAITEPSLPPPGIETWRWLPIFRQILSKTGSGRNRVWHLQMQGENTIQLLASYLDPARHTSIAVFPPFLAGCLELLRWPLEALLSRCGAFCLAGGYLAWSALGVQLLRFADPIGWLTRHALLVPVLFASAISWGYGLRLIFAAIFEFENPARRNPAPEYIAAWIGISSFAVFVVPRAGALAIGWAAALGIWAYITADRFRRNPPVH